MGHSGAASPGSTDLQLPASSGIQQVINQCQLPPLFLSPHFSISLPLPHTKGARLVATSQIPKIRK